MEKRYVAAFTITFILLTIGFLTYLILLNILNTDDSENGTAAFRIKNNDNVIHTITVKLLDSANVSKFNQKYDLAPGENIWPTPVELKKATYTYEVTLDGNITKRQITGEYPEDLSLEFLFIDINGYPEEALELSMTIA
ncbi:hypothetical protein RE474_06680 [Methanolobus sediminis]|uniref:Uncharacterized protein n=1 Tax=Methanolobus sediminis TaxID=3072978 RepID=A0AA51UN95_9EURY|nr:hypothetical protein [Methanolobus sediminis]WMW26387.1 hypothetical protein RE474_06680 [Methanolobus sediminis]